MFIRATANLSGSLHASTRRVPRCSRWRLCMRICCSRHRIRCRRAATAPCDAMPNVSRHACLPATLAGTWRRSMGMVLPGMPAGAVPRSGDALRGSSWIALARTIPNSSCTKMMRSTQLSQHAASSGATCANTNALASQLRSRWCLQLGVCVQPRLLAAEARTLAPHPPILARLPSPAP